MVLNGNTFINNNIRSFIDVECLNIEFDAMNVSNNNFSVSFPFCNQLRMDESERGSVHICTKQRVFIPVHQ